MKSSFKTKLRQLWYPAQFRLPEPEFGKEQLDLLEELIQLIQPTMSVEERSAKDERVSMANFLVDLGTGIWRIRRRIESLSKMPKEVSDALYSLESTWESMSEGGVEIVDYIGSIPPNGEVRVVEVREIPNLAREEVIDAVKPAILLRGEIIQVGEVVVGRPQTVREESEETPTPIAASDEPEREEETPPAEILSESEGEEEMPAESEAPEEYAETEMPPEIETETEIEAELSPADELPDTDAGFQPDELAELPPLIDAESVEEPSGEYADTPGENEPPLIDDEPAETEAELPDEDVAVSSEEHSETEIEEPVSAESDFVLGDGLSDAELRALGALEVEGAEAEIDEPDEIPPLIDYESVDEPSAAEYDNISYEDEPPPINEVETPEIPASDEPPELSEAEAEAVAAADIFEAGRPSSDEPQEPKKRGRKPKNELIAEPEPDSKEPPKKRGRKPKSASALPEPMNEIDDAAIEAMLLGGRGKKRGLKDKTAVEPEPPKKRGRKPKAETDAASEDKPEPKKPGRKKKEK